MALVALLAIAGYVLLPQLADLPGIVKAISHADPRFVAGTLLASAATYAGSALALLGSIPAPVRLLHSMLAAVAATFVGAIAPPGVAHMGLNVRFVQRQGLSWADAVSATAAKEVAMGSAHAAVLLVLALVAGNSGALAAELDRLPSWQATAIGALAVLVALGVAAQVPGIRRIVTESVIPSVAHAVTAMRQLLASPARLTNLFTGGIVMQLGYITALYLASRAVGGDISFVTIGLIYLTVGSAAAVAPTPGAVGAVEAVLLAALTAVGMAAAPALVAVSLYRLATFWLPIPIGGLAMRHLVARDLV